MPGDLPIGRPAPEQPVARPFERVPLQGEGAIWTYMGQGPFMELDAFRAWLEPQEATTDPLFYTIIPHSTGQPSGMGSFMRIDESNGVAEIGNIWFSPALQRSREATESIFLMMRHVLDTQGCRRLEWKCNALNAASRRAAIRFGFEFEGLFRNHMIVKGRNRDTAWFAIVAEEWPAIRNAFEAWLDGANFDADDVQKVSLAELTRQAREASCAPVSGGL